MKVDFGSVAESLSTDTAVLDEVPLERLEAEITGMASRIAAATAAWLSWVGAYDRRRGWAQWDMKSCAHWLNWHCGMSPRTAREHVGVARRLDDLPMVREVFEAGELSYSKVRALCRVTEPESQAEMIALARQATASQLNSVVAKMGRAGVEEIADTLALGAVSFASNWDGTMTMTLTAPVADMAEVRASIEKAVSAKIETERTPQDKTKAATIERLGGQRALRSRTTCELMTGGTHTSEATVLIVADIDALTGQDNAAESTVGGRRVHPDVVRRLCCDSKIQAVVNDPDGAVRATGSSQRIVPTRLRRLVLRRDHGMCQFPGCESHDRLHAHHIIHWERGGPTELDNLVSVCHFHHRKLHEGGWSMRATATGFVFRDPVGNCHSVPVLRLPTARALPTKSGAAAPLAGLGEPANTSYIADVMLANAKLRTVRASA